MDINQVRVADPVRPPDGTDQLRPGQHQAGVSRQCRQEVELGPGQLNRGGVDGDRAAFDVDRQCPNPSQLSAFGGRGRGA